MEPNNELNRSGGLIGVQNGKGAGRRPVSSIVMC